jgi:hypothetical protein
MILVSGDSVLVTRRHFEDNKGATAKTRGGKRENRESTTRRSSRQEKVGRKRVRNA